MNTPPKMIRIPSVDGQGEYDRHVLLPDGIEVKDALTQINDIIHEVNREDDENDGACLDGNSVEENINRRLTSLGFTFLEHFETSNCWDSYDPDYVIQGKPERMKP